MALVLILVGTWGAFAAYPAPGADFEYEAVGVSADWPHHQEGLASHWNKNSNLSWAFDRWFLNLFPREKPVHPQRRRLRDPELRPHARDDDSRAASLAAG